MASTLFHCWWVIIDSVTFYVVIKSEKILDYNRTRNRNA